MSQKNQNRNQQNQVQVHAGNGKNCEQIEVIFAEKTVDGCKRLVSLLGDGTDVFPGSRRFHPKAGVKYLCSVKFVGRGGKVGLAKPVLPYTLSPSEWVSPSDLRTCLVSTLVFRKQTRKDRDGKEFVRLIAWDKGQAVFPDDGVEMPVEKPVVCLLREAGTVAFALPLSVEAQTSQTGLVTLAEAIGEVSLRELSFIIVRDTETKPGTVGAPRAESDLMEVTRYKSVYEILKVSEQATADEIRRAFKSKAPAVHPDRVLQAFGGRDKAPVLVRKTAENYFAALTEAHERALHIIERREQKSRVRSEAKPQAQAAKVETPVVKTEAPKPAAEPTPVAETKSVSKPLTEADAEKLVAAACGVTSTSELRDESADAKKAKPASKKAKAPKADASKEQTEPSAVEKFKAKYGDKAKGATTASKKAKVETKPVEQKGSLADQLATLKLGQ
jgi:hypothetical protein